MTAVDDRTEPETPEQLIAEGLGLDPGYTTRTTPEEEWTAGVVVGDSDAPARFGGKASATFSVANGTGQGTPPCYRHPAWFVERRDPHRFLRGRPTCDGAAPGRPLLYRNRAAAELAAAAAAGPDWRVEEIGPWCCPWCETEFARATLANYEVVE